MGTINLALKVHDKENAVDYFAEKLGPDQGERLIAIRLRTATDLEFDRDASIAWNNRRIIRARMEYYTTTRSKVLN